MDKLMLTGLKVSECNQTITEFSKDLCISSRTLRTYLDSLFFLLDSTVSEHNERLILKYGHYKSIILESADSVIGYADDIRFLRSRIEKLEAMKHDKK